MSGRGRDNAEGELEAGASADLGPPADEQADVSIEARVTAKEVRHLKRPRTRSRIVGDADEESRSERENLPRQVEPGVAYRDVKVAWRLGGRLFRNR